MTIDTSPEQTPGPRYWGVLASELTDTLWHDIMEIYYDTLYAPGKGAQMRPSFYETAADALARLDRGFRLGSRFSVHSKLLPIAEDGGLVRFDFYVNSDFPPHHDPNTPAGAEVEAARQLFLSGVRMNLDEHGLARAIE